VEVSANTGSVRGTFPLGAVSGVDLSEDRELGTNFVLRVLEEMVGEFGYPGCDQCNEIKVKQAKYNGYSDNKK
jgi:hypothetical protein